MYIERIQIEEGFLDGLDVAFEPGLNVVIGARGTGKTSLIELLKFCLDVRGHTPEATKRSMDHALSVLGGGQITVTLADGDRRITVSRTASDPAPRSNGSYLPPLAFSQTEIETVGLQSSGRLSLLSSFVPSSHQAAAESESVGVVRSLTAQAASFRREIEELQRRLAEIPAIDSELEKLAPSEQQLSSLSVQTNQKKQALDALSVEISKKSVASSMLERLREGIGRWRSTIESTVGGRPREEAWPEQDGPNPMVGMRERFERAQNYLNLALAELSQSEADVASVAASRNAARIAAEEQARQLRKDLEALQAGAGNIARQGQQLRERKAQLTALKAVHDQKVEELALLREQRSIALDRLDELRETRFFARDTAAKQLNKVLSPRVRISVTRSGQFESYAAAIVGAFKGSGLRYGDLAPALAKNVSPRDLLEAVEQDDVASIADAAGLSTDRTVRLMAHLRESDLGALGTANVEDLVDFQLLDGADYKDIGELSTGQRCTVVLPIVLQHRERIVIVDQPEDHIDNAFIADTLIVSVLARDPESQILFSSHNANIPVLGDANRVIQLGSDGKRGFVLTAANLDTPEAVAAITTVMEGGLKAFDLRRTFYGRHTPK